MPIRFLDEPVATKPKRKIRFLDEEPKKRRIRFLDEPAIPQVGLPPAEKIELDERAREQEAMPWPVRPPEERRLREVATELPEPPFDIPLAKPIEPLEDIGIEWTPPPEELAIRAPTLRDITPPELKPIEDEINKQVEVEAWNLKVDKNIESVVHSVLEDVRREKAPGEALIKGIIRTSPLGLYRLIPGMAKAETGIPYGFLKEQAPTATLVGELLGTITSLQVLGGITKPIATKMLKKAGGLVNIAPTLVKGIAAGTEFGIRWGTISFLEEAATQIEREKFQVGRLVGRTLSGTGFGVVLGAVSPIPHTAGRIISAGVARGGWVALESMIVKGKLTEEDYSNIGANAILGALFMSINAPQVTKKLKIGTRGDFLFHKILARIKRVNPKMDNRTAEGLAKILMNSPEVNPAWTVTLKKMPSNFKDFTVKQKHAYANTLHREIKKGTPPLKALDKANKVVKDIKIGIEAPVPTQLRPTPTEVIRTESDLFKKAGLTDKQVMAYAKDTVVNGAKLRTGIAEPLIRGEITEAEAISRIKEDVARIKPVEPLKEVVEPPVKPEKPPVAIPKELEPLAVEARKYKTAEEFVEIKTTGFHGTTAGINIRELKSSPTGELGRGLYFSRDYKVARKYGIPDTREIPREKFAIIPLDIGNLKFKRMTNKEFLDLRTTYFDAEQKKLDKIGKEWSGESFKSAVEKMESDIKKEGFDGIYTTDIKGSEQGVVFKSAINKIKTRQQLIDIWKKAQKAKPIPPIKKEAEEIFIKKRVAVGKTAEGREIVNIPEKEGYIKVFKPYGKQGKGYYYIKKSIKVKPIPVKEKVEEVALKLPLYQEEVEKVYQDTIKILKETLDRPEVKRIEKEFANVKSLMRTTYKGPKEIRQIRQRIMAWVRYKGLTKKAVIDIVKDVSGHSLLTHRDITFDQYGKILSKIQRARPKTIGYKTVITKKTEDRIQILKNNLIKREELFIEDYRNILKKTGVKYPAYISRHRFTTESKGKEIINNILDYVPITKQKVKISKAMDRNPIIKRDYERTKRLNKVKYTGRLAKINTIIDVHHQSDSLEKQTGEPIGQLTEQLISKKKELDIVIDNKIALIEKAGGDKFKEIAKNEKTDNRIHRYVASKMPKYVDERPKMPDNITKEEKAVADAIIKGLKGFEGDVRYRRFHEWRKFGTPIPNAPKGELDRATEILEVDGDDALRNWLVGRSWGIRKTGYDIGEFLKHTITLHKVKPSLSKKHLKTKEATIYREYERDIIRRYASYVRQMTMGTELRSEISALRRIVEDNVGRFENPRKVIMSYESFLKEILGQKDPLSAIEKYVIRTWQQASRAIFLDVRKGVRNLFQNLAFYTGKLDLLKIPKIAKEDKEFFDTQVSNKRGIKRDWLYQDYHTDIKLHPVVEYPLRLLEPLNKAADKINVMGNTDEINRIVSFSGKIAATKKTMEKMSEFDKKKEDLLRFQRKVGWGDMTSMEGQHALETLVTQGKRKMGQYIAKAKTVKIHFLYNRFERGTAEMAGEFRRVLSNLLTFRKGTIQRVALDMNKIISPVERRIATGKGVPLRATHSIVIMLVGAAFTGWLYQKLTGDKRNPYRIDNIAGDMSFGGLAMGVQEHIGDFTTGVMASLAGDKAALNRTINNITRSGDMFIPFYDEVINAIEGTLGYVNIDKAVLRQLKVALLKRHKTKPMGFYKTERNLIETGQHIIFGTQKIKETTTQKIRKLKTQLKEEKSVWERDKIRQQIRELSKERRKLKR